MRTIRVPLLAGSMALAILVALGCSVSAAPRPTASPLSGYTVVESDVTVPANQQAEASAPCPKHDDVVGVGGYQSTQGNQETINSSRFNTFEGLVSFDNQSSSAVTGVAVTVCASAKSLKDYSVDVGSTVTVPPNDGDVQATVTCPSGTVSLGGGWYNSGTSVTDGGSTSAPLGKNGWRTYLTAGPDGSTGNAFAACAKKPSGWAQVSSPYSTNAAGTATTVTVKCPKGTKILGGGDFNTSGSWQVGIGLTTSLSSLKGWHTAEDNNSGATNALDAWGVCAET